MPRRRPVWWRWTAPLASWCGAMAQRRLPPVLAVVVGVALVDPARLVVVGLRPLRLVSRVPRLVNKPERLVNRVPRLRARVRKERLVLDAVPVVVRFRPPVAV